MALTSINPNNSYAGNSLPSMQGVLTQPAQNMMGAPTATSTAPTPMTTSSDGTEETQEEDTSQEEDYTGSGSEMTNVFVELMLAQLQFQDPTNPVDSTEFVTQLAMFAQVESMEYMRMTMSALYAVAENNLVVSTEQLIGNEVTAPNDHVTLGPDTVVEGELVLDKDYDNVTIRIYDEFDAEVGTVTLGPQLTGEVDFVIDNTELTLPDGEYRIEAETVIGDEIATTPTYFSGMVNSVTLKGQEGLMLDIEGIGLVPLFDISKISAPPPVESGGDGSEDNTEDNTEETP